MLLERTILLLYGCCSLLDPELNPMAIIQPYLQDFVLGNRDFAADRDRGGARHGDERDDAPGGHATLSDAREPRELEVRVRGLQEGGRAIYAVGRQVDLHGDRPRSRAPRRSNRGGAHEFGMARGLGGRGGCGRCPAAALEPVFAPASR